MHEHLNKQIETLLTPKNHFYQVPKIYTTVRDKAKSVYQTSKNILISSKKLDKRATNACFNFLQDMGVILFNNQTEMACLNPQLIAKALACFVMPPEHEELVFDIVPEIRKLSILPKVILVTH